LVGHTVLGRDARGLIKRITTGGEKKIIYTIEWEGGKMKDPNAEFSTILDYLVIDKIGVKKRKGEAGFHKSQKKRDEVR